ncbi:hypothetical protein [Shewanella youngdeokensis]|uniref:DUF4397 domain-containing protein n=1 Tax=Shewanella youngdeokensis TaxID=2999068 RepID=A0ABZ0JWZ8_9GAMM|nr:hypothetical protein RGE70_15460 [Shewanella sp. DAU334]
MNSIPWRIVGLSVVLATAVGCSSDDDSSSTDAAYIQYYNASANSTSTALELDDYQYGSVSYADSMPRYSYSTGTADIDIIGYDADGDEISLYESTIDLENEAEHLIMLVGDYASPEVVDIQFARTDMDELNDDEDEEYSKMQVLVAHAALDEASFDVYFGLEGEDFSAATMIDTVSYKGYSTELMYDTGSYVLYLTEVGETEPVFTTTALDLTDNTVYKFIIRNSFGPGTPKLTIDSVDSTTTPTSYANIDAIAEYRFFNSLNDVDNIDIDIASKDEQQFIYGLEKHTLSDFEAIGFNDYGVTITNTDSKEELANNLLVTFNQDESKSILVYEDEYGATKGMTITHDHRPRAFEHEIDFANLVHDYDGLQIYFVSPTETIDSTDYVIDDIEFTELENISLPSGEYEISVVYQDDNDTLTLLYQSDAVTFESAGNYTMVLNKDDTEPLGYRLTTF